MRVYLLTHVMCKFLSACTFKVRKKTSKQPKLMDYLISRLQEGITYVHHLSNGEKER